MWSIKARTFGFIALTLALAPALAGQVGRGDQGSGASATPRWEHAFLQLSVSSPMPVETTEGGKVTKTYRRGIRVCVAQANGCRHRTIETTFAMVQEGGAREPDEADLGRDALANALAQLGAEGWELVIQGSPEAWLGTVLYFKRQAR